MEPTDVIEIKIPRTLFGVGALHGIGRMVRDLGSKDILIVTDEGLVAAGIVADVQAALASDGLGADVFDECLPEAPLSVCDKIARLVAEKGYDLLIAVGGGSVLDAAKTAGVLAANPGTTAQDLFEGRIPSTSVPRLLIPTTSGTGSEWSNVAVVTTDSDDRNHGWVSHLNLVEAVIIDPELTKNLPARITADSAIDALTHAIQGYTSSTASLFTDMCASTAIRLIGTSLRPAFAKASLHTEDRHRLSLATSLAMLSASVAGNGLEHFISHAFYYKKLRHSHGAKVGLLLPHVMEFNLIANPEKFAEIARLLGENTCGISVMEAAERSITAVRRLLNDVGNPLRLSEIGVTEADIPRVVEEVMGYWIGAANYMSPREVEAKDVEEILRNAL
ncbi:MAG: iron-containing alcohol dehydrogenase [Thermoleophilia bacterium]|nr:iron-containing alcohol dehydrogenase [Thermoleophilia bacterium]